MDLRTVSLDDKYISTSGQLLLTGTQALVRLALLQSWRDQERGLKTAGFISGYRGSPLGGLDQDLWQAKRFLEQAHIHFKPGLNEELAATALWGTQQANLFEGSMVDGVFGLWYGKGPGVDRSGDVFKHGNAAGTSRHGGILVLTGDDHLCKSSSLPHQSEYALVDAMIPVLHPSHLEDILRLGLYGWDLSRYSGCWVGMKLTGDTVDTTGVVDFGTIESISPSDFLLPPSGLHIRWPDSPLAQEERLHHFKLPAVKAFVRANHLDQVIINTPSPRLGIVTTGKAYGDVQQALMDLGIGPELAGSYGLRLYKVALTWPLEEQGLRAFAQGLEEILVVEEKRPLMETQVKDILYNSMSQRPRVVGKQDEMGRPFLPSTYELSPVLVARALVQRLMKMGTAGDLPQRLAALEVRVPQLNAEDDLIKRTPFYCSGCPHNTSTKTPEGSRALAGIGCHYMAMWIDDNTTTFAQMGGEGVTWIGQAPFTERKHIFANMGDGTYLHSGILALRASVAAGVNITYKILFNSAVAMTGGQPLDSALTVDDLTHQVYAEGIKKIAVVTDDLSRYVDSMTFAPGVTLHSRREFDAVQKSMVSWPGVSVIVYDQMCATEKRRWWKRGTLPRPSQRIFINEEVCEGCGDCSKKSNCLSVVPVDTPLGRKRQIDQSSCNRDTRCVDGFCPSFVTIEGGMLRTPVLYQKEKISLPEPVQPNLEQPFNILLTGIGGTGIVTLGAIMAMAAHLESKGCTTLDMAGLSQKGGAVITHVRFASSPAKLPVARISAGGAHVVISGDLAVSASADAVKLIQKGTTQVVVNNHPSITGEFVKNPEHHIPADILLERIAAETGSEHLMSINASALSTRLIGDPLGANVLLLGYAFQKELIPLSSDAILRALEENKANVEENKWAFYYGRRAAHDPAWLASFSFSFTTSPTTLDDLIADRRQRLTKYQNKKYAARYEELVRKAHAVEQALYPAKEDLACVVAQSYFKIMAYKDEYEVARLYSNGHFEAMLKDKLEGNYRVTYHLAPPLLAQKDPETGLLLKKKFGPWMRHCFAVLAKLKFLRGTVFDLFGYTNEKRAERALILAYHNALEKQLATLTKETYDEVIQLAQMPQRVRGFGHVKKPTLVSVLEYFKALA